MGYSLDSPASGIEVTISTTTEVGERRLQVHYAGGLVKHLGLSMYRGAVPALAELIANAWDADAARVKVTIPSDSGFEDKVITVVDDGRGMSWDQVDGGYLIVGRDRRKAGGERTPGGCTIMGRKGLGKLAGFGIARVAEARTVRDPLNHAGRDRARFKLDEHTRPDRQSHSASVRDPLSGCKQSQPIQTLESNSHVLCWRKTKESVMTEEWPCPDLDHLVPANCRRGAKPSQDDTRDAIQGGRREVAHDATCDRRFSRSDGA